jgi:hypothetical protein
VVGRDKVEEWLKRMVATRAAARGRGRRCQRPPVADDDGPARYRSFRGA